MAGYDGSLKFDTEISEKGFNSGITKLGSLAKGGLTVLSGAIGSVTAALGAGAVAGMKYNASIETYQTSFEVMTGSAEKAAEVIDRLKKVGAETPFELPELADTTQLLMNYGLTADEAMDKMMMLGDISQGSADKMSRIAMAYGQMSSAGKVQLEDVKQMIEAGFNPLQEISESKERCTINNQTDFLKQYYEMLYPEKLKDNEYIRMLALRRDESGQVGTAKGDKITNYVKDFES